MKGWKTILFSIAVIILGIVQMPELSAAVGGCIFDSSATQPTTCVMPSWLISLIGLLVLVLRFVTSSSIFSKTDDTTTK